MGILGPRIKRLNNQWVVNSKTIKKLKLEHLGDDPYVVEAIILRPDRISIGNNVGLNYGVWINGIGQITIGNDVNIGPYTVLHSSNHNYKDKDISIREQGHTHKKIVIENNVWIGAHCSILAGSHIEEGCVIGAGAVITKRIPKNSVVVGANKIIGTR